MLIAVSGIYFVKRDGIKFSSDSGIVKTNAPVHTTITCERLDKSEKVTTRPIPIGIAAIAITTKRPAGKRTASAKQAPIHIRMNILADIAVNTERRRHACRR